MRECINIVNIFLCDRLSKFLAMATDKSDVPRHPFPFFTMLYYTYSSLANATSGAFTAS